MKEKTENSEKLFKKAKKYIPGGVNSPVRAFQSVGGVPRFIEKGIGAYIYDIDGNEYIDYVNSWGPMILGHRNKEIEKSVQEAIEKGLSFGAATESEVKMAELICELVPSIEMIRMVNSGTEAVMSAIRVARGYTGKEKIIKFAGCYHGHSDGLLVSAGSGLMTGGIPNSAGVTQGCVQDTLVAVYNDIESVEQIFKKFGKEIAAIIVEPVAANMGVVIPKKNFLQQLREICDQYNSLLIFDEVITGFRLQLDGAQGWFHVKPDITTFGKIIGAGMPVGAYGGKKEIMEIIAPCGDVYQAGTLSGNPIAMTAGLTQLKILKEHPEIYQNINNLGNRLYKSIQKIILEANVDCQVNYIGSLGCIFFTNELVTDYNSARKSNIKKYADYFHFMLGHGIFFAPSQFEAIFLSNAHGEKEIEKTIEIFQEYFLDEIRK